MLTKWLTHVLSGLLVASLCGLIVSSVLGQTLMNGRYLEGQLTKVNAYNRLSVGLSGEMSKQAGLSGNPEITAKIQSVITPEVLRQRINPVLDQLTLYYEGKGPALSIDLSGLTQQVQAIGVPLPADNSLASPVKVVPNSGTNKTVAHPGKSFSTAHTISLISSIVLAFAVLGLSLLQRRYIVLPGVVISVGVIIGLGALMLELAPSLFDHFVKFSSTSNTFASLGHDLAAAIVRDLAKRFGIIAGVFLVVGVGARVALTRLVKKPALPPRVLQPGPTATK